MTMKKQLLIRFIILALLLAVSASLILSGCSVPQTISTMFQAVNSDVSGRILPEATPTQTVSSAPVPVVSAS